MAQIEFHEDMSQLKNKIQGILKGPLRKEQIYFVNGESPEFKKGLSLSERIKVSKSKIDNESVQVSNKNNMKLK